MNKKTRIMLAGVGAGALLLSGVAVISGAKAGIIPALGAEVTWGIDLSQEENAFVAGEKQNVQSKLGNSFEFISSGLSAQEGAYAKLAKGAKLGNSTIIHQIKSLEVTFSAGAELSVEWGWEADSLLRESPIESGVAFAFEGDLPDYFLLKADTEAVLDSLSLRFNCSSVSSESKDSYAGLIAGKGYYEATVSGSKLGIRLNGAKNADLYLGGESLGKAYFAKAEEGYTLSTADGKTSLAVPSALDGKALLLKGTFNEKSLAVSGTSFTRALDLSLIEHENGYRFSAEYDGGHYEMSFVDGEGVVGIQGKDDSKSYGYLVIEGTTYALHRLGGEWKYRLSDAQEGFSFAKWNLKTLLGLETWKFVSLSEGKLTFDAEGQLNKGDGFVATFGATCAVTNTSWSYLRARLVVDAATGAIQTVTMGGKYSSSPSYSYSDSETYSFEGIESLGVEASLGTGIATGGEAGDGIGEEFGE